jgi:hypothetical protein
MGRGTFEAVIDHPWPQDGVVVRVNWPRVAFALLPGCLKFLPCRSVIDPGDSEPPDIPAVDLACNLSNGPRGCARRLG